MKQPFKIRANVQKVTMLNKPLLLTLAAVIVFILLWSISSAFKTNKPIQNKSPSLLEHNMRASDNTVSPLIAQLPQNYQDVNGIKKYLNPQSPLPPEVVQQLSDLRSQTAMLQEQLQDLQSHPAAPPVPVVDQDTMSARKSSLFFSAGAPPSNAFDQDNSTKSSTVNNAYTPPGTTYDQQNMQNQKINFVQDTSNSGDIYNHYSMVKPASPYEVQAGTILAANLLTAINTSLPGDIIAQVRQDVYNTTDGQYLLIPKGSKLLGKYDSKVAYGQSRILIVFDRIIRPDGTSIQLSNFTGSDDLGQSGFNANVNNHWGKVLGAATISTMLSFGAGVVADRNTGTNPYYPSSQQSAIVGAAGSISQTGQNLTNKAMDVQPTLTVPAGFNFSVIVNKDMILSPYNGKKL